MVLNPQGFPRKVVKRTAVSVLLSELGDGCSSWHELLHSCACLGQGGDRLAGQWISGLACFCLDRDCTESWQAAGCLLSPPVMKVKQQCP